MSSAGYACAGALPEGRLSHVWSRDHGAAHGGAVGWGLGPDAGLGARGRAGPAGAGVSVQNVRCWCVCVKTPKSGLSQAAKPWTRTPAAPQAHQAAVDSGGAVVKIPMIERHVRSLNLSTSVGIGLYEALRQLDGAVLPEEQQLDPLAPRSDYNANPADAACA